MGEQSQSWFFLSGVVLLSIYAHLMVAVKMIFAQHANIIQEKPHNLWFSCRRPESWCHKTDGDERREAGRGSRR